MNAIETVKLCRLVKALCPAQAIDEWTPDVWHEALAHIDAAVAGEAVKELSQTHRFISPADIASEVGRMRAKKLQMAPPPEEPEWLREIEDEAEHARMSLAWRRERQRRILADEPEPVEPPREIVKRDLSGIIAELSEGKGGRRKGFGGDKPHAEGCDENGHLPVGSN